MMGYMYAPLTALDRNNNVVGDIAKSWSVSPNHLRYAFQLQRTKFSDGTALTASDVKYSLDRMRNGAIMKAALASIRRVVVVNSQTVEIDLSTPNEALPLTLSRQGSAGILKRGVGEKQGYFTKPTATSGPFVLSSYVPNVRASFNTNKDYFSPAHIAGIDITLTNANVAAAAALESGSTDIASVDYSDVQALRASGKVRIETYRSLAPIFFGWDQTKPPFSDVRVRQAFAYALDRAGAANACWFGLAQVSYGNLLLPSDPNYVRVATYKSTSASAADAKAAKLLDQAGWVLNGSGERVAKNVPGVADGAPFEVTVPYENNWSAAACHTQILQASMAKVGVKITPNAYDAASFYQQVAKGAFEMYHAGDAANDAYDIYLNWFTCHGGATNITTHLCNPTIDKWVAQAGAAPTAAVAKPIYQKLERWQGANLPMLVDTYFVSVFGISKRVKNYHPGSNALIAITISNK
jgi:peptide/nickel transport system substrate-binding protein